MRLRKWEALGEAALATEHFWEISIRATSVGPSARWQVKRHRPADTAPFGKLSARLTAMQLIQWSWTGIQVVKHDGSEHHGVGIHPTVPVSATVKGIAEGRDEVLE